ncbi:MAG: cytochrome c biogenesis protein [Planctomycetota bacterium]|jgi:ABC-type transport system involved in cytochrome c biogenesis permease subunit
MKSFGQVFPWLMLVVFGLYLGSKARPAGDDVGQMKIHEFGQLPVVYQGRVKPFDTLARNGLVMVSDKQTFTNTKGDRRPAIEWLLDVMSQSPAAYEHKVFRIHNLELLDMLGLERRKGYRYALEEFRENIGKLDESANQARAREPGARDVFDNAALALADKVGIIYRFGQTHSFPPQLNSREDVEKVRSQHEYLMRFPLPHSVPPAPEGEETEEVLVDESANDWQPFMRAVLLAMISPDRNPAINHIGALLQSYHEKDIDAFNERLGQYQVYLAGAGIEGVDAAKLGFESKFNNFEPFYYSAVIYLIAFLMCVFGWLGWAQPLNKAAFLLIAMTAVVHTGAIVARIYISGYPPITNLYGTAIFIGWGCVLTGIIVEAMFKLGVGNLVAAVSGFVTLLIAHFLGLDGDTLEMMQAVLDTKFWLATHVIVINLGYMAALFAGLIGMVYILRGVLTRSIDKANEKVLGRMMYGVLCFGMLTSFLGTVLGGLWADDSWGRFWGWDPKENGALIIVLWIALILHARWGGMIKVRGMAILSVFGGICTAWSWFGVNQLGVGLHSYGFIDSVAFWLMVYVGSQLAVMAIGMIPKSKWRSFAPDSTPKSKLDSDTPPDAEPVAG